MQRNFRIAGLGAAVLLLTGCASVNIDQALQETNQSTLGFTQGKLELSRTEQQRQSRGRLSEQLLAQPLTMDDAVQLAKQAARDLPPLLAIRAQYMPAERAI